MWTHTSTSFLYGLDWWLPYFEELGFITNCDANKPTEFITLYRGVEEPFAVGMSWTNQLWLAKSFIHRNKIFRDMDKHLYESVVKPEHILAIIKDINGDGNAIEYIVNYKGIDNIRKVF